MDPKRTARFLVEKANELLREAALLGPHCGLGEGAEDLQCAINDALVATQEAKGYLVAEKATAEDKRAEAYRQGWNTGRRGAIEEALLESDRSQEPAAAFRALVRMKEGLGTNG